MSVSWDAFRYAAVALSFGLFVTTHLALCWGIAVRGAPWRALLAFVLLPLAPAFALRKRLRVRALVWLTALSTYVLALLFAAEGSEAPLAREQPRPTRLAPGADPTRGGRTTGTATGTTTGGAAGQAPSP